MSRSIITIDDSFASRRLVALILKEAGHHVLEAENGEVGLDILCLFKVDLIVSDVDIPGMSGIELTRCVRGLKAYREVPIILLSTDSRSARKAAAKAAGANCWIEKPFSSEKLSGICQQFLLKSPTQTNT